MSRLRKAGFTIYWIAVAPVIFVVCIGGGLLIGLAAFKKYWPRWLREAWYKIETGQRFLGIEDSGEDDDGS